jgi:Glycosyltransferase Family 4
MSALRVLITINQLTAYDGEGMYVRDLATGLLNHGHTPMVYSPKLGDVASELRAATIAVVDDLNQVASPPDIIHGHNHHSTMMAVLHFYGVPALYTCHSQALPPDAPPHFPRIRVDIGVDYACYDRLVVECRIPEERVHVLFNAVDLKRVQPRGPLPASPQRALVFSNYASKQTYLGAVQKACARAGILLDVIGAGVGRVCPHPEQVLGQYDLVFAKARCALEALATGSAVILCDAQGVGPMVTTGALDTLRRFNFGRRVLREPIRPAILAREMARYDPVDATAVSQRIRAIAGHDDLMHDLIRIYEHVVADHRRSQAIDGHAEGRAAAPYLRQLQSEQLAPQCAIDRLRERIQRIPWLGPTAVQLARVMLNRLAP